MEKHIMIGKIDSTRFRERQPMKWIHTITATKTMDAGYHQTSTKLNSFSFFSLSSHHLSQVTVYRKQVRNRILPYYSKRKTVCQKDIEKRPTFGRC